MLFVRGVISSDPIIESGIAAKVSLHDSMKANMWQKKKVDM